MDEVFLFEAVFWVCPKCGHETFMKLEGVTFEGDAQESAYRQYHHLDPWETLPEGWEEFTFCKVPDQVSCSCCGGAFLAVGQEITDDDDNDDY